MTSVRRSCSTARRGSPLNTSCSGQCSIVWVIRNSASLLLPCCQCGLHHAVKMPGSGDDFGRNKPPILIYIFIACMSVCVWMAAACTLLLNPLLPGLHLPTCIMQPNPQLSTAHGGPCCTVAQSIFATSPGLYWLPTIQLACFRAKSPAVESSSPTVHACHM